MPTVVDFFIGFPINYDGVNYDGELHKVANIVTYLHMIGTSWRTVIELQIIRTNVIYLRVCKEHMKNGYAYRSAIIRNLIRAVAAITYHFVSRFIKRY